MKLAFIGGTGNLGFGLALRCALAGYPVVIGSRELVKAQEAVERLTKEAGENTIQVYAKQNVDAAAEADIVVLSLSYQVHEAVLPTLREACAGKIVLDTTVPMQFGKPPVYIGTPVGAAAQQVQQILSQAHVLSGFHTIPAASLADLNRVLECHGLLCGDSTEDKNTIIHIFSAFIPRVIDIGGLDMAQSLERLTPLIVAINQRYKRRHVGIKLTNI